MAQKNPPHNPNSAVYIKPQSQREEEYLKQHQIHLNRLENGMTVVGIHRPATDRAQAQITISFATGSYFDPPGKEGAHHFFEHFFNKKVRHFATPMDVVVNAATSATEVNEYIYGPASHQVSDFGIWPIISLVRSALASPFTDLKNLDQLIKQEKKVIASEINEHLASHDFLVKKYFRQLVFDKKNPLLSYPPGTKEGLDSITKKDLEELVNEVLIPDGTIINFISEGDKKIFSKMANHLQKLFENFPRRNKKAKKIDWQLMDSINPMFGQQKIYQKTSGLNNNLISALLAWILPAPLFTPETHALWRLVPILHNNLFMLFRRQGWGYSVRASLNVPGEKVAILVLQLDLPKQKGLENKIRKILPHIKKYVFDSISPHQTEQLFLLERKRQKASPISAETRLKWLTKGLREKGKIIDADAVKTIYKQITPDHFKIWIEKLTAEAPAVILIGDL